MEKYCCVPVNVNGWLERTTFPKTERESIDHHPNDGNAADAAGYLPSLFFIHPTRCDRPTTLEATLHSLVRILLSPSSAQEQKEKETSSSGHHTDKHRRAHTQSVVVLSSLPAIAVGNSAKLAPYCSFSSFSTTSSLSLASLSLSGQSRFLF